VHVRYPLHPAPYITYILYIHILFIYIYICICCPTPPSFLPSSLLQGTHTPSLSAPPPTHTRERGRGGEGEGEGRGGGGVGAYVQGKEEVVVHVRYSLLPVLYIILHINI